MSYPIKYPDYKKDYRKKFVWIAVILAAWFVLCLFVAGKVWAAEYTDIQIANAIYHAEGGAKTKHPYGILAHYKHTTPRQACLNTIAHARRDWNGRGDFLEFLQKRYCPIGAKNDPRGLNKNWLKNVRRLLAKDKK